MHFSPLQQRLPTVYTFSTSSVSSLSNRRLTFINDYYPKKRENRENESKTNKQRNIQTNKILEQLSCLLLSLKLTDCMNCWPKPGHLQAISR